MQALSPTGRGFMFAAAPSLRLAPPVRLLSYALLGGLAAICLLVAAAAGAVLLGYHTYIVYGGSMGAGLPQGSLAIAGPVDAATLEVGDVIALDRDSGDGATLHRIVAIDDESGQRIATTQGDENATPDAEPVALTGRGDRVLVSVPYLGYLLHFGQSGVGRLLLIVLPLALLSLTFLRDGSPALPRWGALIGSVRPQPAVRGSPPAPWAVPPAAAPAEAPRAATEPAAAAGPFATSEGDRRPAAAQRAPARPAPFAHREQLEPPQTAWAAPAPPRDDLPRFLVRQLEQNRGRSVSAPVSGGPEPIVFPRRPARRPEAWERRAA